MQVDLLCPILLIAADTPAADKLCGHYSNYTEGVQHVTCSCDISFSDLDDPNFACRRVTWEAMHAIVTSGSKEECAAMSQHQCRNAFTNMEIGDKSSGIHGVCILFFVRHFFTFTIAPIQSQHHCLYSALSLSSPHTIVLCITVPTHPATKP